MKIKKKKKKKKSQSQNRNWTMNQKQQCISPNFPRKIEMMILIQSIWFLSDEIL